MTSSQAAPTSYAVQVIKDTPIGYWRLGEAIGSTSAVDLSGHGNNGAYSSSGVTLEQPGLSRRRYRSPI